MGVKCAYRRLRNALRKWLIVIVSETTKESSFKIQQALAIVSLYIFTGNDVTSYFRSAANRINVFSLCHVWIVISR